MAIDDLGRQLAHEVIVTGEVRFYERGLTLSGRLGVVEVRFEFPMVGKPDIAAATYTHRYMRVVDPAHWAPEEIEVALGRVLRDRLGLVAVGQPSARVALVTTRIDVRDRVIELIELTATGLVDRQLYDFAVNGDAGWTVVAPHAVYCRHRWTDFGIVHISDMHVAKRIDSFRSILKAAGRGQGAARLYNWNDRFRGFVRYANHLHAIGVLDVIVATGDCYDYQFEVGDDVETSGGNAAFLRDLILGKAPGPDFPDVEELRAPIFLIPGNHDYRLYPYRLVFDLKLPRSWSTLWNLFSTIPLKRIPNYNGFRLSENDAALLSNALFGEQGTDVPTLRPSDAERMVEYNPSHIRPYRQHLVGAFGSYVIELGPHRIAMIDSAHDLGKPEDIVEAAVITLIGGTEDQDAFVGASPNCRGIDDQAMHDVDKALLSSDPNGLFIVALHAPLFNPPNDEYGYFMRETQRAVQRDQIHGFLARDGAQVTNADILAGIEAQHDTWFPDPDGDDRSPPRYVKRVNTQDHLDHGVSRQNAETLMKLLAGVGSRGADLVLAGHTHCYNEYRVGKASGSDELVYYMDFYTQNPTNYYKTKFTRGWQTVQQHVVRSDRDETYVEVVPGAAPDVTPWPMPYDALEKYMVQVPPYANPLNSAPDPRAWWKEHRPLVLQTGALGPYKKSEFFTGFRVIAVKNDVIDKIHYVSIDRLEKHQYGLDWEKAILPEGTPRQYQYVERSRPLGSPPAVGVPSANWFAGTGSGIAVYRDPEGRLHELWRKGNDTGTSDVVALGSNAMRAAGDPTTYIDTIDNLEVVLYRGTDGHVYSLYWSTGEVRRDELSRSIDAPRAHGKPVGYLGKDGYWHAIYRETSGHLHELWWTGPDRPGNGRIHRAEAPLAAGDPVAYQKPNDGENSVIYLGSDGHIHRLYWITGDPLHQELSHGAGAPKAAGDPAAYHTAFDDVHQAVYRAFNGHIHELYWRGNVRASHWDLTAATPDAPVAADDGTGDPIAYYSAADNKKHVIYRSKDGHLNELSWVPGGGAPTHIDLTVHAVAPVAADKPAAFVAPPNTQHVFYRGTDNQLHEIRASHPVTVAHEFGDAFLVLR